MDTDEQSAAQAHKQAAEKLESVQDSVRKALDHLKDVNRGMKETENPMYKVKAAVKISEEADHVSVETSEAVAFRRLFSMK
jgi:hypothetical protein